MVRRGGVGFALLLLLCAVHSGCKPSHSLPLEEVVCLINERTSLQLNYEQPEYASWHTNTSPRATVVEEDIQNWNIGHVIRLVRQWPHLHIVTNQGVYTLCPKNGFTNGISFDAEAPPIILSNAHPFQAGYQLALKLPFNFVCAGPHGFDWGGGPMHLQVDFDWWPTNTFIARSFNITNASIRDAMVTMLNTQAKAYWIAKPYDRKTIQNDLKHREIVMFEVFLPKQNQSKSLARQRKQSGG